MDFVRSMWLVLCISVCGVSLTCAEGVPIEGASLQEGPAGASTASNRPFGTPIETSSQVVQAAAAQTGATTYYGAPFQDKTGQWRMDTVSGAMQRSWANYQAAWPSAFPGCNLNVTYTNNGVSTDIFATYFLSGTCGGSGDIFGTAYSYVPGKNTGKPCNCAGDPINLGTGNEYRDDQDASVGVLSFHRYYNSQPAAPTSHIGAHWRHSFDRSLAYLTYGTTSTATVFRPDGLQVVFTLQNGQWVADADVADRLTEQTGTSGNLTGWLYFDASTRFTESYDPNGNLLSIADANGLVTTLTYSTVSTPITVAPTVGLLLTITDPRGRILSFTYNSSSEVATVTEPDGGLLTYAYNSSGNLTSVTYPDTTSRQYVYNESSLTGGVSLPNALTGDIDETNTRYTSIGYNAQGQATKSMLGSNIDETQVSYGSNGTTTVTYPTGVQTTLSFATPYGSMHAASISVPCGPSCGQPNAAATFDSNGYPASTTDFKGNLATTIYDVNGLLDTQVDASGTSSQRTTNTTWNTALRVPLQSTVVNASGTAVAETTWVYNHIGQPLARCEIDPAQASGYTCAVAGAVAIGVRRWTYTYCTAVDGVQCPLVGLLLSVTGPRTDLIQTTTYSYYMTSSATSCGTPGAACYQAGDLYQVTDALGHITTVASYDGAGRVTRSTDANGINTDLTYTPRGWLATRSIGGATTTLGYTPYGAIASITDPDSVITTFTYDAAHRLTDITDAQGNDIHYTLDAAGDKTAEQTRRASGTAVRSLSRTYNTLGQLTAIVDGLSHTVFNASTSGNYDANGNLVQSADALGYQHQQSFDALNRLTSTIANYNGTDPATTNTTTTVSQDALDRVAGVTDPTALTTSFAYDGLSNRTQLQSPDTGTSTDTFDAAGNRLAHTDAKGVVSTSIYDALNRLTGTSYTDTTQNVSNTYDEANAVTGCSASSPIGRLTRVVESAVTTVFCYDSRGNVIEKMQQTSTNNDITHYSYTAANRLSGESTPDQTAISYTYDSDGHVNGVTATPSGATTASPTVVSAITWLPFGPISSYTLGNGQTITRTYDANYRLTDLTSPALNLHFARDAMGDIVALGNAPGANPATETYSYDPLYRLTSITDNGTALETVTYNPTGDRLSKTAPGLATGTYLYTTGTHQLASIGNAAQANDANGNTTGSVMGGNTYGFAYNGRNRLTLVQLNGQTVASYTYNALGERIGKVENFPQNVSERYAYDESGQLIGEYGTINRDYIWLGDLPVAVVDNTINGSVTTSTINYVTADQLNTPRVVTNSVGTVIWQLPYAGNAFEELQPTSASGYVLNLRSAGEYYDAETGLNSNGYRTRNPYVWRFGQSDPEGLAGGISTYAAVGNNPLSYVDPLGLFPPPEEDTAEENTPETNAILQDLKSRAELDREVKEANASDGGMGRGNPFDPSEFGPTASCKLPGMAPSRVGPPGSTGRSLPENLTEQMALKQAKSDPDAGRLVPLRNGMTDPRWPGSDGWVKMSQNVNGVEIHYVQNVNTGETTDFKIK
jgi:RHS repeat-associated protein